MIKKPKSKKKVLPERGKTAKKSFTPTGIVELEVHRDAKLSMSYQSSGFSVSMKIKCNAEEREEAQQWLNEQVEREFQNQLEDQQSLIRSVAAGMGR